MGELADLLMAGYDLTFDHTSDGFIKVVARKPGRRYASQATPGVQETRAYRLALRACLFDIAVRVGKDDDQHVTIASVKL